MNSSPNRAFRLALSYVRHTENPKWMFVRNISIQWIATLTIPYICTRVEIKFKEGKKRQSTAKRNEWSAQKWEQFVICKESLSNIQTLEQDLLYFLYKIYIYIASYKILLVTSISVLLQFAIYLCYIFGYTTWIPKTKWKSEERQKKMWKKEEAERIHRLMRSGRSFFLNNILHREMLCITCVQLLSSSWWMSSSSSSCVVECRFSHRNISFVVFSQKLRYTLFPFGLNLRKIFSMHSHTSRLESISIRNTQRKAFGCYGHIYGKRESEQDLNAEWNMKTQNFSDWKCRRKKIEENASIWKWGIAWNEYPKQHQCSGNGIGWFPCTWHNTFSYTNPQTPNGFFFFCSPIFFHCLPLSSRRHFS